MIVDIDEDGNIEINWDDELVGEYGDESSGDDGKSQKQASKKPPLVVISDSRAWCDVTDKNYKER